jgi:hypothetical protein
LGKRQPAPTARREECITSLSLHQPLLLSEVIFHAKWCSYGGYFTESWERSAVSTDESPLPSTRNQSWRNRRSTERAEGDPSIRFSHFFELQFCMTVKWNNIQHIPKVKLCLKKKCSSILIRQPEIKLFGVLNINLFPLFQLHTDRF